MQLLHPDEIPSLVYANQKGEIKNFPEIHMAGRSGNFFERARIRAFALFLLHGPQLTTSKDSTCLVYNLNHTIQ